MWEMSARLRMVAIATRCVAHAGPRKKSIVVTSAAASANGSECVMARWLKSEVSETRSDHPIASMSGRAAHVAAATQTRRVRAAPTRRVCVAAATCAALPDIDAIGWSLRVSDTSLFSHRAITHSLPFALAAALVTTMLFFRGPAWATQRVAIATILSLALISHICLDAMSTYSVGVEFFA